MDLIFEFVSILTSAAACLYCFVLNRKLQGLGNTKKGIGASIVAMTQSITDAQAGIKEATSEASAASGKLEGQIEAAKALRVSLMAFEKKVQASTEGAAVDFENSIAHLVQQLRKAVDASLENKPVPEFEFEDRVRNRKQDESEAEADAEDDDDCWVIDDPEDEAVEEDSTEPVVKAPKESAPSGGAGGVILNDEPEEPVDPSAPVKPIPLDLDDIQGAA